MCYEIWCTRNKKCLEGIEIDVATTIQKAQRSIANFNSANMVLLETLSGGSNIPISNHYYKIGKI
jgi:hypothetical protein